MAAELHSATAGNPLFVDGVMRIWVAEGRLGDSAQPDEYDFKLPASVRETIRRRIEALPDSTRSVLATAAVFGSEFELSPLAQVAELSTGLALESLDEALRAGTVVAMSHERFRFAHALIRREVYEGLGRAEKLRMHGRISEVLEGLSQANLGPHLAELAHHFREAGITESAIDYSIRAGDAAYALFAYEEAGGHWHAALELMDEQGGGAPRQLAGLLQRLGDELVCSGPEAIQFLEAAVPLYEKLGDKKTLALVHSRLALYLSAANLGAMDMRRALPHFEQAEELLGLPESPEHGRLYTATAAACIWAMRVQDGLAAAQKLTKLGECAHDDFYSYSCIGPALSSTFLVRSGRVREGLELVRLARERAESSNDTMLGSTIAWIASYNFGLLGYPQEALSWCTRELENPRTARSAVRRAILLEESVGHYIGMGELSKARSIADALGEASRRPRFLDLLLLQGDWDRALEGATQWLESSRSAGNRLFEVVALGILATIHRISGNRAQAAELLRNVIAVCVETGSVVHELPNRCMLAQRAADVGNIDEALPHLQRIREIVAGGEDWRGLTGGVHRAEAVIVAAQGNLTKADAHFERAIANFRQYRRPWEEAETLHYWGRALLAAGERARAIEKFDAAIEIYRRHGAGQRWIERVEIDRGRATSAHTAEAPPGSDLVPQHNGGRGE